MSDGSGKIAGSAGLPLIPRDLDDETIDASESFADDKLGAKLKKREADKRKQAKDRRGAEARKRLSDWSKVREASSFTGAQEKSPKRSVPGGATTPNALSERQVPSERENPRSLVAEEKRIAEVFEELTVLLEELETIEGLGALDGAVSELQGRRDKHIAALLELAESQVLYEQQLRGMLMALLSGAFGFRLLRDPYLSFRSLFSRLRYWPKSVPPGHLPQSSEDYDLFVSWAFSPPELGDEDLVPSEE